MSQATRLCSSSCSYLGTSLTFVLARLINEHIAFHHEDLRFGAFGG